MKKLMFAAAVAAISTVGFSDVVSSSVVGYQNKALTGGAKFDFCVNTFKGVGKEISSMKLGDVGVSSDWQTGADQLKTLTSGGGIQAAYTYVKASDASDWGCPEGWYLTADIEDESIEDLSPYCKNDVTLPMTQGVLLSVNSSGTTLVYSGEVLSTEQPISLTGGAKFDFTGNISPVDLTLGDITADNSWQTGADQLKTLTSGGGILAAYTFVKASDASDWGCPTGWYLTADIEDESIEDLTPYCKNGLEVTAGQAFLVSVNSSSTTITIPSAL